MHSNISVALIVFSSLTFPIREKSNENPVTEKFRKRKAAYLQFKTIFSDSGETQIFLYDIEQLLGLHLPLYISKRCLSTNEPGIPTVLLLMVTKKKKEKLFSYNFSYFLYLSPEIPLAMKNQTKKQMGEGVYTGFFCSLRAAIQFP